MDCQDMVRLRWEGNGSTRYDGKTQDVAVRFLVPEVGNKTTTVQVGEHSTREVGPPVQGVEGSGGRPGRGCGYA